MVENERERERERWRWRGRGRGRKGPRLVALHAYITSSYLRRYLNMVAYTCDEACGQPSMVITAPLEPVCGSVIESGTGELKISDCLGNAGSVATIGWKRARVQTHMTPRFRNRQARTVDLNFIPGRNYSVPPLVGDFQLGTAAVAGRCCRCWSLLLLLILMMLMLTT